MSDKNRFDPIPQLKVSPAFKPAYLFHFPHFFGVQITYGKLTLHLVNCQVKSAGIYALLFAHGNAHDAQYTMHMLCTFLHAYGNYFFGLNGGQNRFRSQFRNKYTSI